MGEGSWVHLPRSKERRIALRQALNCDSIVTKASSDRMRGLETRVALQMCPKLRQGTGFFNLFLHQPLDTSCF